MVTIWIALASMTACALAEWLHARRIRRLAYLAFGPAGRPRRGVEFASAVRTLAVGAIIWGLVTLWRLDLVEQRRTAESAADPKALRHLVIGLDVSPSMNLEDAGPLAKQSRGDRAREVLRSLLDRLDLRQTRVSLIAFYGTARPVVVDTFDLEVIANILDDLPLEHAFAPGKTNLYESVSAAAELAKAWRSGSAALVIASDGDTLPAKDFPHLSPAYSDVLVLGLGDAYHGQFLDGHVSRQDSASLEQLARQLHGQYLDVNSRHVPSLRLQSIAAVMPALETNIFGKREWAVAALLIGAAGLALVSPLLAIAGGAWNPARARPVESYVFQEGASAIKSGTGKEQNALGSRTRLSPEV